jgi:hypothetical protein
VQAAGSSQSHARRKLTGTGLGREAGGYAHARCSNEQGTGKRPPPGDVAHDHSREQERTCPEQEATGHQPSELAVNVLRDLVSSGIQPVVREVLGDQDQQEYAHRSSGEYT